MNDLQIFNNEEFGQIRMIELNGEPWFIGKDLADDLKYQNGSRDIARHVDEEDRQTINVHDGTQYREMIIVNESGMYALIMGSKLDNAKKFKRWITKEVIPSIRKNGGYIAGQEKMTPAQIVANALIVANSIIEERDKQIAEMQPKADYFDALVDRKLNTSFRDTAKELNIGERRFIEWLKENKYIYRDQKKQIRPYSEKNKGLFVVKEYRAQHSDHAGLQTLITPKGRETFRLLLGGEAE